jgi:hypothetical protein
VILCGDFHLLRQKVLHGMIRAVVPELQFEGLAAERQAAQLVAEANAEYRNAADELADILHRVIDWLGIARAI